MAHHGEAAARLPRHVQFFRTYIQGFAHIAAPLYELTQGPAAKARRGAPAADIEQQWSTSHEDAFQQLKRALTSAPVPAQPDWSGTLYLHTDYSGTAVGAVLT
mmetsp:Transcript_38512/g.108854  ORF Transcript_38512/g.108854 Transcript_38512/m.108854 type:complete len:103 (+) Transcript_38512:905-1213(+)